MQPQIITTPASLQPGRDAMLAGNVPAAAQFFSSMESQEPLAVYFTLVSTAMAEEVSASSLTTVWNQIASHLSQTPCSCWEEHVLCAYEAIQFFLHRLYDDCNQRQKEEYTALNREVSFENKERILSSLQRILLEAEEEYNAMFHVMFSYLNLVLDALPSSSPSPEIVTMLVNMGKSVAELSTEVSLPKDCDLLALTARICSLHLPHEEDLLSARNTMVTIALKDPSALDHWDFWSEYAACAGVEKKQLEKLAKKKKRQAELKRLFSFKKRSD